MYCRIAEHTHSLCCILTAGEKHRTGPHRAAQTADRRPDSTNERPAVNCEKAVHEHIVNVKMESLYMYLLAHLTGDTWVCQTSKIRKEADTDLSGNTSVYSRNKQNQTPSAA